MKHRSSQQEGFTLIEVLVGLVISASVIAGLTTLASSVNIGWSQVVRKLSSQEKVSTGLAIAAGDISRIQRIADRQSKPPQFHFHGQPSSITFVVQERPASGAKGLYWVHLFSRQTRSGTALIRVHAPFYTTDGSAAAAKWADEVVLSEGGFSFSFSYKRAHGASDAWLYDWREHDTLPGLVRIQTTESRTGAQAYPPMVIALKVSAEAACVNIESPDCTMKSLGKLMSEKN